MKQPLPPALNPVIQEFERQFANGWTPCDPPPNTGKRIPFESLPDLRAGKRKKEPKQ